MTYYRLDDGGAIVRETGGWNTEIQVDGQWVDALPYDINLATDAREVPAAEALAELEGEFAPQEPGVEA